MTPENERIMLASPFWSPEWYQPLREACCLGCAHERLGFPGSRPHDCGGLEKVAADEITVPKLMKLIGKRVLRRIRKLTHGS